MPPRDASEAPKMRVVIAPASSSSSSAATSSSPASFSAHAFSLPHPRTGKDVQYLLHRSRRGRRADEARTASSSVVVTLLEASRFAPSHGSWFYGGGGEKEGGSAGAVCSDPGVLLLTEVDPLFVALPALCSARALRGSNAEQQQQRREEKENDEGEEGSAANNDGGRFVDAEAAVCGGERGEDSGKRAAAALALLVALAGGRDAEEGNQDAEMAPPPPPSSSSSPPRPLDCSSPPLSLSPPPSPRSKARSDLLRAAGDALSSVCEVKTVGGDSYFRLCERRTRAWLRLKAGAAAAALKRTGGPAFAGLEGEALEAAGGALIAEWLPREWSERMGWPSPGTGGIASSSSSSRPASASTTQAPAAAPSWATPATATAAAGPFTRDPNLPSETETFAQREERYQQAGDFAKRVKLDAAAAAREKARAVRQDAKALAAKKEASTMKSLAGFFVVKKKK